MTPEFKFTFFCKLMGLKETTEKYCAKRWFKANQFNERDTRGRLKAGRPKHLSCINCAQGLEVVHRWRICKYCGIQPDSSFKSKAGVVCIPCRTKVCKKVRRAVLVGKIAKECGL